MGLGRVQVQLPSIDSLDLSPWARVATMMAGLTYGTYFIPNTGDDVLVAFEHGDVRVPYVIGCLWNSLARPPLLSPLPQTRVLRTPLGNQIVFDDAQSTITIQSEPTSPVPIPTPPSPIGPHQTLKLSPIGAEVTGTSVLLQAGENKIFITSVGIVLQAGESIVSITSGGIQIVAGKNVLISGGAHVQILGAEVGINS
jgi:phage baseplate assembly protein gpV